jgi:hypothetical protein
MEKKYFALSAPENNRVVKIIQVIFGIVCFGVAAFWLFFNIRSLKADKTLWITILFLCGFGFYQIWSGFGMAARFIEISSQTIRLKKTILLRSVEIQASEIEKIELYPLNLIILLKSKRKVLLRFGTTYQETNEKIKDELLVFADLNSIELEFVEEKL